MTDQQLMDSIKTHYGEGIAAVCHNTSIPPAFLAALVANETGGDANAKRFEPGVLAAFWQVLMGRKPSYDVISRKSVLLFVVSAFVDADPESAPAVVNVPASIPADALQRLDRLATSFGITQIMGWHCLESGSRLAAPDDSVQPATALNESVRILAEFALRYQLDLAKDFADLFDCWNSGDPVAGPRHTFDPEYVPKGLRRMALYHT